MTIINQCALKALRPFEKKEFKDSYPALGYFALFLSSAHLSLPTLALVQIQTILSPLKRNSFSASWLMLQWQLPHLLRSFQKTRYRL